jgi:hypothetical protein
MVGSIVSKFVFDSLPPELRNLKSYSLSLETND